MITTTMTSNEILKEYREDYRDYIKPKLSSLASRKTHDLKVAKGKWIPLKDVKVKTRTGNNYNLKCKLRWDKKRGAGWNSVSYLSTSDSKTGKKVVYIFSDEFPIQLTSSFLREIKTSVSEFLGHGAIWDIMTSPSSEDERYTSWIDMGDLGAAIGGWESGVLVLRHLFKDWETDPISEFLKTRTIEAEDEFLTKKNEVDLAWEAYFSGNLGLPSEKA